MQLIAKYNSVLKFTFSEMRSCLTTIFELTERITFEPILAVYQSIFFSPFHIKPHLILLQEDRVDIISLETGINISSWRFFLID